MSLGDPILMVECDKCGRVEHLNLTTKSCWRSVGGWCAALLSLVFVATTFNTGCVADYEYAALSSCSSFCDKIDSLQGRETLSVVDWDVHVPSCSCMSPGSR